ncbi:tyrosine-type recombinase/integrase [Mariniflexile sp. AS56]|uniref:tyrosine-type recombinase/integrase n=1 Tax=Mariniflexile sp. AS56 TaxID=3063957 RepID=UPI0026ECFD7F|nr:site-specific integrase [Mariniflexile sp. AS56]MDO7173451.1 tyrosine-type recombinase/integrase [Mariniflexile sp. AS56]
MNLKYFIVKGKKKYLSIYVRFWDSKRIDQKTRTGISVLYSDWSESKQRLKIKATTTNVDYINNKLNNLEVFVIDKYNKDYSNKKHISSTWLKDCVTNFFGRVEGDEEHKAYLVPWVKKFVKEAPDRLHKGKQIKARSVKNYTTTLNKLISFEEHQKRKYRFEDIDLNFHQEFIHYCRDIEKLNNNSIGNIISRIKTFCREIEFDGYAINPQYKSSNFSAPKNETFDTYLNEEEINKIFNHDFSKSERLDNVRDLFIIGLRTGLRVSDFLRIKKENILGNVINITTLKTEQNLTIPIHPQFQKILDKRQGGFPQSISDQKFNKYIKEVCKEAGIDTPTYGSGVKEGEKKKTLDIFPKHELITSHCCRRSFATNLFLAGFDNATIMAATGHKSTKQFIQYVKASNEEHIKKLSEYWEKQNKKGN